MRINQIQTFWSDDYRKLADFVNNFLADLGQEVVDIKITPIRHDDYVVVLHATIIYTEEY